MKKNILVILVIFSISFSTAFPNQSFFEKVASIKNNLYKISAHDLCALLEIPYIPTTLITADILKEEMSTNNDLLVINVLPEVYYNDCHIKGSFNAPLKKLVDLAQSWDRSQKIVLYCALDECDAGEKGCILLHCMGFNDVRDYRGGIKEWYQLGYPTEGPALSDYLQTKSFPILEWEKIQNIL